MKRNTRYVAALLVILMIGCSVSSNAFAQSAEIKIGFVDLQRVIDSSEEGKRAQGEIQQKAQEFGEQAKQKQEEIQTFQADYQKQFDLLTPEARAEKQNDIAKLERDYTRFAQDSQNELRLIEQRALKQLLESVGKVVVEYGRANNYTLILEAGGILYGADSIELTEDILNTYNSR